MGASNGGIAVKTDTSAIDLSRVVKDLFGNDFEKSAERCDARFPNCVYASKTKDFLIIINTDFADKFFRKGDTSAISKYLEYFSNPSFVFAFEEYDSGGTYSYCLIYDGVIRRQFRSESYETAVDYGEPEPIEVIWKNAETYREQLEEDLYETYYKDPGGTELVLSEESLPRFFLHSLMQEKLGFTSWEMHEFTIESGHFARVERSAVDIQHNTEKKPWWKVWLSRPEITLHIS